MTGFLMCVCVCVGEDPLVDDQADHDINSVAGVLKLYFRGLENSLFPKERFLDFISTTSEFSRNTSEQKVLCLPGIFSLVFTLHFYVCFSNFRT